VWFLPKKGRWPKVLGVLAVNQTRYEETMQISKTRWRLEKDMSFFCERYERMQWIKKEGWKK
jgi:inorganic pyrophosphatase